MAPGIHRSCLCVRVVFLRWYEFDAAVFAGLRYTAYFGIYK